MKKKMLGLLLSTAMLATTVAGCGSTAATTASAPAAEETAKTEAAESTAADTADTEAAAGDSSELAYTGELEIMHYSTSEESEGNGGSDGFRTVLGEWDDAHPDITLTQTVLANAEYKTQIATLAAADDLPDFAHRLPPLSMGKITVTGEVRFSCGLCSLCRERFSCR